MYNPDSDNVVNGDFGMTEHDDNINNDNKEQIPIAKVQPIKHNKKNKPSLLTVKKSSL